MIWIMLDASADRGKEDLENPLAGMDRHLLAAARMLRRPAGATLFRVGQRPAWMYYVHSGEAQMQRVTSSGTPLILQRAAHGFLAEASLTSPRYHCEGSCRTDSTLIALPLAALRDAIDNDEGTRWAWIGLLSAQSRQQRARLERQALKTIRERLQHLIVCEGTAEQGYPLPGTKLDLAADLGVTPEALYRCLSTLQADGLLTIKGRWLRWCD